MVESAIRSVAVATEEFAKGGTEPNVAVGVFDVEANDEFAGAVEELETRNADRELAVMAVSGDCSLIDDDDATDTVNVVVEDIVVLSKSESLYTFRRSGPPQISDWFIRQGMLQPVVSGSPICIVASRRLLPHQHSTQSAHLVKRQLLGEMIEITYLQHTPLQRI